MKDTINNRNQKSLRNLILEDELINRGVIFHQFPHLMMIYSGLSESKSDFNLKTARLLRNNPGLTSDGMFYRKIRDGSVSREDFRKYFNNITKPESVEKQMALHDSYVSNSKSTGGWCLLDSAVRGLKLSNRNPKLQGYLDFILFICDSEKKYICAAYANSSSANTLRVNELSQHWLCLPENHFDEPTVEKLVQYLIARVLLWAALFEKFIIIDQPELLVSTSDNGTPFTLNKYIPKIDQKGDVWHSVEVFLDDIKTQWGKLQYSKDKISWPQFSRDVANAMTDKVSETDPESIRKNIQRMRKGGQPLTIKSFENNVAVLYETNEDFDKFDSTRMIIPFIQLFDNIQRELIKKGIPKEKIVKQFEKYPDYLDLFSRRYKNFSVGKLQPK